MKRNTKGFTLIELLAVIVILAVIALIATPTILGMISKARQSAAESDMLSYVNEIERQILADTMDGDKLPATGNFKIKNGGKTIVQWDGTTEGREIQLKIKGDRPDLGTDDKPIENTFTVSQDGEITLAQMKFGNYYVRYELKDNNFVKCSETGKFPTGC